MNFEIEFPYNSDTVYLAYSRPYPYSEIITRMFEFENRIKKLTKSSQSDNKSIVKNKKTFLLRIQRKYLTYERKLLCMTICGLPVPQMHITANNTNLSHPTPLHRRKVVIVTARVHPGETNASTVFEGVMHELINNHENSPLLAHFIFKMVPCMNPDGVVCGNYRSSLAGVDLNRQWIIPSQELHPEVYHTKDLMSRLTNKENR